MKSRHLLLAVSLGAIAVACSGGGGDDDDSGTTPSPTPVAVDYCQVVWVSQEPIVTTTTNYDIFLVDAPLASWTTGTKSYGVSAPGTFLGVFYDGRFDANEPARNAAVTTSGTFDLVLADGTTTDAGVEFEDTTTQTFFSLDQATGSVSSMTGTGGTGFFSGQWSNPDALPVTPGEAGLITITYNGTSQQIGTSGIYAICYDRFQAATLVSRTHETLRRLFNRH